MVNSPGKIDADRSVCMPDCFDRIKAAMMG